MMKRLYYLTKNITIAERVSDRLHEEGITDWHFHVLAKDKANVVRHHLHSATPLQELDIIRSGERGILGGFLVGILAAGCMALFIATGEPMSLWLQAAVVLLFSCFGAWVGGLVGVSSENYKIRRFHDDIEAGALLIMVDVSLDQRRAGRDVIDEYDQIREAGEDSTLITPFSTPSTS
jgi:hypothetical protein